MPSQQQALNRWAVAGFAELEEGLARQGITAMSAFFMGLFVYEADPELWKAFAQRVYDVTGESDGLISDRQRLEQATQTIREQFDAIRNGERNG